MIKVRLKKTKKKRARSSSSVPAPRAAAVAAAVPPALKAGLLNLTVSNGLDWLKKPTSQTSSSAPASASATPPIAKVGNSEKSAAKMKKFKNQKRKERRKQLAVDSQQAAPPLEEEEEAKPEAPTTVAAGAGAAVDYEEWEVKKTGTIPGWRAAAKAQARALLEAAAAGNLDEAPSGPPAAPFAGDDADHAETSAQAYEDVIQLLDHVALTLGKTRATLAVYDPYYCDGSVVKKLNKLGFKNVYNQHEDFYVKIATDSVPDHDVVVTNPPYSADHMEKCFRFCAQGNNNKPWFVLVPNFVYTKNYYEGAVGALTPSYVVPKKRYYYFPPAWAMGAAKSRHRHKGLWTSPFPSFWYFHAGTKAKHTQVLARKDQLIPRTAELAATLDTLPSGVRAELDQKKKRKNPKARKRASQKRLAENSADIHNSKMTVESMKKRRF